MQKLTNDQLEILVQKRNQLGFTHTVEVMNNEELASYKINCTEAIERLTNQINKAKTGGVMQQVLIENKEMLEGFITYIDSKLNEQPEQTGEQVIDTFLVNWKARAFNYYMNARNEYEAVRSQTYELTEDNLKCIVDAWGRRKLNDEQITNMLQSELPQTKIDWLQSQIRYHKVNEWKKQFAKHEVALICDKMYGSQKEQVLRNVLERDAEARKIKLIATITNKAGTILNANGLSFGKNGDINGTVIGDKAKVNVTTITAGGFNIQALHYRVLVKVIK